MALSFDGVHSLELCAGRKGGLPGILEKGGWLRAHEMAASRRMVRSIGVAGADKAVQEKYLTNALVFEIDGGVAHHRSVFQHTGRQMDRIFIMGNGGSGKTWLAQQLAERLRSPAFHLDDFHWMPNFAGERPRDQRDQLVAEAADGSFWIMEGIYGSILKQVLPRVTTLIWLDVSDEECISNLLQRGQTGGGTEEQFEELLEYTRGYRRRKNHMNSFDAHEWFFQKHPRHKLRLHSRTDVAVFLATI